MIFKQLPTAISDLNKLGIALKSLDTMNIGAVGVNTANLESYRTALKGLSIEQSVFALASKGATEEQIRQILVTNQATASEVEAAMAKAGLTTATKALTQAEMVEMATKNGVAKTEAEALLRKIGITATEESQVVVKKQVTRAMLEQAVTSGILTTAEASQIANMLALNATEAANIGITNVLTASFTKLFAVINAHPIGAILIAVGAVAVGTIAYINKVNKDAKKALVEAHENAEKALEDTKTSLSDDKSELQSINSELEQTKDKIEEISSIGTPTLTEQNELDKLSTANAQLETQKSLLENNIKLKQKAAALDAKELLGTQVEMEYSDILDNSSIVSKNESYTYKEHAKYQAHRLQNAYGIYMTALDKGDVKRQKLAQELITASSGNVAEYVSELLEIIETFKYDDGTIIEGYEDIYNEYMGMIYNLQSLTNPDTFLDIAKSITDGTDIDYEKAISEAYALAYEGNFDIDKLNQDFVKALVDAGIDESTISYIFRLKQKEYQLLVDKINNKYRVQDPDKIKQDYLVDNGDGTAYIYSGYRDTDEEEKNRIEEINTINQSLNDYAKENPVEFQLVASYDEGFTLLDKYIEEEKEKVENEAEEARLLIESELKSLENGGNVNLTLRPQISTSDLNAKGWDAGEGTATVFSSTYSNEDGTVAVNFTPIIVDPKTGEYLGVMSPDELQEYAEGVIAGTREDDLNLQVGAKFEGEDAIDQAVNSAEKIHDLHARYFGDTKNNTDFIEKYVMAAINRIYDEAAKSRILDDETAISFSDIFSLKDAKNNLTDLGKINEEIDKFQSAYKGLKEAMDSYNETGTFTLDQVQEIISYGGDYLKYLMDENGNLQLNEEALNKVAIARINEMRAKALSNLMDKLDTITNEEQALSYLETQLLNTATAYDALTASRIKAWSENALENGISQETINKVTKSFENQVSAINEMFNSISLDSIYKSPSSSATKDAEQATKDYIDSYMNYMEKSLETGRIDYHTYSRDVAKFLKDMYDQGKIAAKDYHDYTKQMLEVQKEVKLCLAS